MVHITSNKIACKIEAYVIIGTNKIANPPPSPKWIAERASCRSPPAPEEEHNVFSTRRKALLQKKEKETIGIGKSKHGSAAE